MKKSTLLNVIAVGTLIELLSFIILPFVVLKNSMELGAVVLGFIFIVLIIYYTAFVFFLARYSKREPERQNIGLVIFLNLLPLIIYGFIIITR